jgi:GTP:adenosylcobinamide-phosphate guanylyltransferase
VTYTGVVLAGSRPGGDPLAQQLGAELKPLIAVTGEPMVRRPVRALLASGQIGDVILLTQAVDQMAEALPKDERIHLRRSTETIAATMLALCDDPDTRWPLLVTTADHALLDARMIDEFCRAADGADVAIGMVERRVLQRRFPQSRRTWLKFRGGAYSGANLFALRSPKVAPAIALWRSVEQDRKKGWRLIALLGPLVLIGAALRLLSIDDVLERAGRKLGLTVRAVRLSNPLAAIDVDTMEDHALVESILEGRA